MRGSCVIRLSRVSLDQIKTSFKCKTWIKMEDRCSSENCAQNGDRDSRELEPSQNSKSRNFGSLYRSFKKKCKSTLSYPKSRFKSKSSRVQVQASIPSIEAVSLDTRSIETIDRMVSEIPPPVPERTLPSLDNSLAETNSDRSIQEELSSLARHGWYWGPISQSEVEEKLKNEPDGAFLVRDSKSDNYLLSLSFRSMGRTMHSRIQHTASFYSLQTQHQGYKSIAELIETSMRLSKHTVLCYAQRDNDTDYPVRLTKPVLRFVEVRSLQHLCRFVIRQYISVNNIESLPLPQVLHSYLLQSRYW